MTTDLLSTTGNLPAEPNSFVGRERDLAELAVILGDVRILTLCGPGGIGKTRLALRLAADIAAQYPDGAWIVDLTDAKDSGPLAPMIATVLGIHPEPDHPLAGTLTEALRPRSMLLILDTCEHLLEACAALVPVMLAACPGLRVISTSREPLRIRGEVTWRVAPLGLPPVPPDGEIGYQDADVSESAGCEAVRLFAERGAAARPGFVLDGVNTGAVVRLCRTLDGMPLAIELAAARLRALSVEQIAGRLDDRFALLAAGARGAPKRQQTLRATIDWSFDLLTEPEQVLLRRLSVFAGWSLEMAERVCAYGQLATARMVDLIAALLDKSLVILDGELLGEARYRLLDTVREYAADQAEAAGETAGLRVAHRDCMLALQERGVSRAFAPADISWPERVAVYYRGVAEQANTRAALACCVDRGDAEEGLRLCAALRPIWLTGGDATDGAAMLDRLLRLEADVPASVRTRALSLRAELAVDQQDPGAPGFAEQCLEVSRAGLGVADPAALRVKAVVALLAGRVEEAAELADAGLAAARETANEWEVGVALVVKAATIAFGGKLEEAQHAYEVALEVLGENRGWGRAQALIGLGRLAAARGDAASALRYFGAALTMYRQINARSDIARCLALIGRVALAQGDLPQAASKLTESLRLSLATGQRLAVARGIEAQAVLAAAAGNAAGALMLASTSRALSAAIGAAPSARATKRFGDLLTTVRGELGPAAASALVDQGQAMSAYTAFQLIAAGRLPDAPDGAEPQAAEPAAADGHSPAGQPDPVGQPDPADQRALEALTPRELQIAALVARGYTNARIAAELSIQPSTAARHVANILAKLGFGSRARIAAWATEHMPR
jgi:predicted ATPase/DNA-binding NarL/FixJ family response regulator